MMRRLESRVDTRSAQYQAFRDRNLARIEEFRRRQHEARYERPERDRKRLEHHGKLFIRDRIDKLLDPGTPFLELSSLAACTEYEGDSKSASIVVGLGIVSGREVIVRADDPSIKGGAWYPLSVKKIVRSLDIAIQNRLPMIHMCDSAGGFLPMQADLFPDRDKAGRIFATGPGGVWIFSPEGAHLGTIQPEEVPANVGWGDNGNTLYMTARTGLYRIRLNTEGNLP